VLPPLPRAEEILISDPRGRLSPAQMVEQKLLALLRTGNPGLYAQAAGGRQDVRRTGPGLEANDPSLGALAAPSP
jgi:hypothetical protein